MRSIMGIPMSRFIIYIGCLVAGIIYLGWSFWPKEKIGAKEFQIPNQARGLAKIPKIDGPLLTVPVKIIPKAAVNKLYPDAKVATNEEVVNSADIPASDNGHTMIDTIDKETGEVHSQIKEKKAPWFALQNKNAIGLGAEQYINGTQKAKLYYRRDLLRIKDIYIAGELSGKLPLSGGNDTKIEGSIGVYTEWRF